MSDIKFLYHGTSIRHLPSILENGLRPRQRKKGNWSHTVESNPRAVYLTNSYPMHFASNAGDVAAVFEIDMERLHPWKLAPDEDFLEQATRDAPNFKHVTGTMQERTRWFRKRALSEFHDAWILSLEKMGTCCYYDAIMPGWITRYAIVQLRAPLRLLSDPTIGLLNYAILGGYYRDYVRKLFGDEIINDKPSFDDYHNNLIKCSREGIEVIKLR